MTEASRQIHQINQLSVIPRRDYAVEGELQDTPCSIAVTAEKYFQEPVDRKG
jgi:hypothetical protein